MTIGVTLTSQVWVPVLNCGRGWANQLRGGKRFCTRRFA